MYYPSILFVTLVSYSTVSFLEASLLKKLYFWCYFSGVSPAAIRNRSLKRDFSFFVILLFLGLGASVLSLGNVLLQRLDVTGIFAILIYVIYLEKL